MVLKGVTLIGENEYLQNNFRSYKDNSESLRIIFRSKVKFGYILVVTIIVGEGEKHSRCRPL